MADHGDGTRLVIGALRSRARYGPGLVLAPVLLAALGLRIWGIDFGLPNTLTRPDETTIVHRALAIGAGDLNPHFFRYPSLHFYVMAFVYGLYYLAGLATGRFGGVDGFQYEFFADPSTIFILGRSVSAVMGTASVALVYGIAARWCGRAAGMLSALFLSVAFLHVRDSHFLTLDVPATFYLLVACLCAWWHFDRPRASTAVAAGVFLGLAAATKYNVVLLAPTVLLMVYRSPARSHDRDDSAADRDLHGLSSPWRFVGLSSIGALLAFAAGSPYVFLDFSTFVADITAESGQFSAGRAVDLGRGWGYHLHTSLPLGMGWPLLAASSAGCLWLAWRREKRDLALLAGLLAYYVVAGSGRSVYLRYMLPLVPLLCVVGGVFVATMAQRFGTGRRRYGILAIGVLLAAPTAVASWRHDSLLAGPDTRQQAATWIGEHIPAGSTIALAGSAYGYPRVTRSRLWLEHARDDLTRNGFDAERLRLMLALPDYPPEPSYYTVELRPENPQGLRTVSTQSSTSTLRQMGVEWVVTQDHPLPFSQLPPSLAAALSTDADLVVSFSPFASGGARPSYDPIDAFYAPVDGFAAAAGTGPVIGIHRLRR